MPVGKTGLAEMESATYEELACCVWNKLQITLLARYDTFLFIYFGKCFFSRSNTSPSVSP